MYATMTRVRHTTVGSPLGELTIVRDDAGITGLYFPHHWYRPDPATFGPHAGEGFGDVRTQLEEYFGGERTRFDLPLNLGGTPFQRRVWELIAQIPSGETTTYGRIGREIEASAQDVGAAVGRNPVCIIIGCHRVIGANGKLTGYAGGLARKRWLLDLERGDGLW
jgi:methylated-DNA-[protein]-cysteine S-methyltransferase